MKTKLILSGLLAFVLISCDKDDDTTVDPSVDTEAPMVVISSPNDSSHAMSGMMMHILAQVTDNDEIHEIHLNVRNKTQDSLMLHVHEHAHGQTAVVDTAFVIPNFGPHQDYEIKIEASDHAGNTTIKIVDKHVHM